MKNSIIVLFCFVAGILCGQILSPQFVEHISDLPHWLLYLLIIQVGLNLGANTDLRSLLRSLHFTDLLLPLFTIVGTLLASALVWFLLQGWSITDVLAMGSGMGYYSLSSILIVQLREAALGADVAAQLGAIALLTNILREMLALIGAPLYARMGRYALISVSGVTSMDVCLPVIVRYLGKWAVPLSILHGIVLEVSIPILVSLFCSL